MVKSFDKEKHGAYSGRAAASGDDDDTVDDYHIFDDDHHIYDDDYQIYDDEVIGLVMPGLVP